MLPQTRKKDKKGQSQQQLQQQNHHNPKVEAITHVGQPGDQDP